MRQQEHDTKSTAYSLALFVHTAECRLAALPRSADRTDIPKPVREKNSQLDEGIQQTLPMRSISC